MARIDWNASLSVGVESVDEQHKKLIALINRLDDVVAAGKERETLAQVFKEVIHYTGYHFSTEERFMEQTRFAGTVAHKTEHQRFVDKVFALHRDFIAGKVMITMEITSFLKDWVAGHIQGTDKKYSATFIEQGIK